MAAGSKVGAPKLTPCEPIALASSTTLATCKSALDGMQPTLRQTPPSVGRDVDQNDVLPQIGGAESGGVAAGTGAQNQDIGLEIGLPAGIGGRLRRWTCGRGGLGSRLLDFDAAASGVGGRRGFRRRRLSRLLRLSAGRIGRQHVALGDLVADLDADLADHAILGRRHVHARLVAFERQDRLVLADALPGRDEDFDDRHILEVADVGEPDFFRHASSLYRAAVTE